MRDDTETVCVSHVCTNMWKYSLSFMVEAVTFTHVVFSFHWEAERLKKQWEEEEEERLKQTYVPAKPKGKRMTLTVCLVY